MSVEDHIEAFQRQRYGLWEPYTVFLTFTCNFVLFKKINLFFVEV